MSWLDNFFAGYQTVQVNGVAYPAERILNLVGVTAADDPANGRTTVTVAAGGSGYQTVQWNGLALTQRDILNFIGGTAADNSGSTRTDVTLPPALPSVDGFYILQRASGVFTWVTPTQDMISAGLSVVISGSSNSTFECGNTWVSTGVTSSPACNASGVTAATINDTLGGSTNVLGVANPLSTPGGNYLQTPSGAVVSISVTMTKSGVTKTSNLLTSTWLDRYYVGQGSGGGATAATASGNNASLSGDTGTLTGVLATFPVGASFVVPASLGYTYLWVLRTSTAMTFKSGGAPFPMSRVTHDSSYSNQFTISHLFDLYVSNLLNPPVAMTVVRDT